VEIQTDKIKRRDPLAGRGHARVDHVAEGTTVLVGTEIGTLAVANEAAAAPVPVTAAAPAAVAPAAVAPVAAQVAAAPAPAAPAATAPRVRARGALEDRTLSPAVRRLMREHDVTLAELRTLAGSASRAASRATTCSSTRSGAGRRLPRPPRPPRPWRSRPRPRSAARLPLGLRHARGRRAREETIPFTRVRKLIAENMVKAKHTAAHTHCFDEVDMSAIVALRKEWAPRLEKQGVKLTYMPFFIKASVLALKEYPWVNGAVSPEGDAMVLKRYYNIGMAVGRGTRGSSFPTSRTATARTWCRSRPR